MSCASPDSNLPNPTNAVPDGHDRRCCWCWPQLWWLPQPPRRRSAHMPPPRRRRGGWG